MMRSLLFGWSVWVVLCGWSWTAFGGESFLKSGITRSGALELRIALRAFESTNYTGTVVWLSGVAHIGTSNYYARLQEHLNSMDVVLYEGVNDPQQAREAAREEKEEEPSLQGEVARALGLEFQLDAIDYSPPHFINSDMTTQQLMDLVRNSKDPARTAKDLNALFKAIGPGSFAAQVMSLVGKGLGSHPRLRDYALVAMIEVLGSLDGDITEMQDLPAGQRELMELIVKGRNTAVFNHLQEQLERENPPATISVFYGAAHMYDLEKRMMAELGFVPVKTQWLTAMRVVPSEAGVGSSRIQWMRKIIRQEMKEKFAGSP